MTKQELAKQYADKKVDERREYTQYDLSKRARMKHEQEAKPKATVVDMDFNV